MRQLLHDALPVLGWTVPGAQSGHFVTTPTAPVVPVPAVPAEHKLQAYPVPQFPVWHEHVAPDVVVAALDVAPNAHGK